MAKQWKELTQSILVCTATPTQSKAFKEIKKKKKSQMTKDLAMQGSCIAKSISIHSYPRDLNEMEFQERVESVGKKQEKKLGV